MHLVRPYTTGPLHKTGAQSRPIAACRVVSDLPRARNLVYLTNCGDRGENGAVGQPSVGWRTRHAPYLVPRRRATDTRTKSNPPRAVISAARRRPHTRTDPFDRKQRRRGRPARRPAGLVGGPSARLYLDGGV